MGSKTEWEQERIVIGKRNGGWGKKNAKGKRKYKSRHGEETNFFILTLQNTFFFISKFAILTTRQCYYRPLRLPRHSQPHSLLLSLVKRQRQSKYTSQLIANLATNLMTRHWTQNMPK